MFWPLRAKQIAGGGGGGERLGGLVSRSHSPYFAYESFIKTMISTQFNVFTRHILIYKKCDKCEVKQALGAQVLTGRIS